MNAETYQEIDLLQKDIEACRIKILELRATLQPELISDYTFIDAQGKEVKLSALFGHRHELLVLHNMGKKCSYCTLWADGFNGYNLPLNDRMPTVLISPDSYLQQQEFATSRGWKFKMVSASQNEFIKDLGFEPEPGKYWPGASALIKKDGQIFRTSYDHFGPGDAYCAPWHLFDLFPARDAGWKPKIKYGV